jgi:hypothetical protein
MEGKDGNPLNEPRVLRDSLMLHDGRLCAHRSIKLSPVASVLKLQVGDEVGLNENDHRAPLRTRCSPRSKPRTS